MNPAQRQIALRKMALPAIPDDWDVVTVGSIAQKKPNSIVGGPFGSDLVSTDYVHSGVPVIRGQNMGQAFVSGDFVFVSDEKAKALSSNLAAPGDVVFTQRGTLGQVSVVPDSPFDRYLISQSQMKLSVDSQRFDVAFLCQYFSSAAGQQQVLESAIQTGVPHTNLTILRGYFLPRPPLPEQQAIAAALSDADGVVAGLERVIAKKRLIKQGAMQDLLTARRRLPGFSGEWEVKRLGDHVRFLKNGTHSRAQLSEHGPVKNLHYGDIHGAASIFLSPATKPMPTLDLLSAGRLDRLAAGDLVFVDASEDLAGVGTSVEVTDLGETEVVSGLHTIAARFDKSILVDGFKAFLQFVPAFRSHLCQLAAGTKVLATNRRHISSAEIALPRPDEQQAIAAALSDIDTEIQTLESRLAKARSLKEGMMQNLLTGRVRLV